MYSHRELSDDKSGKTRMKSRKTMKHRNNSIISSNLKDSIHEQKNQSNCQSRNSIISDKSTEISNLKLKIQELTQDNSDLSEILKSRETEYQFLNQIIPQFVDINEYLKIKQSSTYDQVSKKWLLPNFAVEHKKRLFPQLHPKAQLKEVAKIDSKVRKNTILYEEVFEKPGGDYGVPGEKTCREGEGRPSTSISKYRQTSLDFGNYEAREALRRSPGLCAKPKF